METTFPHENGQIGVDDVIGHDPGPGDFPIEALSPVMREIADSVADVYQIPTSMPAVAALAVHAGAVGKTYRVVGAVNGQQSYGNLYVIVAAARGGGKSTVAGILAKPLMMANDELSRKFLPTKTALEARAGLLGKQIEGLLRKAMKPSEDETALLRELETKKRELAEAAPDGLPILTPSI
jgi:hypothetical protein